LEKRERIITSKPNTSESPGPGQFKRNSSFLERVSSRASFLGLRFGVFLPSNR
jgi:hypothetical protein